MVSKLMIQAGVIGMIAVGVGASMADRKMNYVETDARITASEKECYIESRRSKLVEKDTGKLAYVDCDMAPMLAAMHEYDESDIHPVVRYEFRFTSPVDGSSQKGEGLKKNAVDGYERGNMVTIYAHKTEAAKYRIN